MNHSKDLQPKKQKPNPQETALQLRRPTGPRAQDFADRMNKANRRANLEAISALEIGAGHKVLEIGPGNGAFASTIVSTSEDVTYVGVDWSEEMVFSARSLNMELILQGSISFQVGNSDQLPFRNNSFDRVLTIHTVYFWNRPEEHLRELRRVLKPEGRFCIGFGDASFMKHLPFTKYGFHLYRSQEMEEMVSNCGFDLLQLQKIQETGPSNTGDMIEKIITIMKCRPHSTTHRLV